MAGGSPQSTASAILALSPSASSGVEPREGADALLSSDRGITADGEDGVLEIEAEDRALTLAAEDLLTAVKTGDVTTLKDALSNAILAIHPRYREE